MTQCIPAVLAFEIVLGTEQALPSYGYAYTAAAELMRHTGYGAVGIKDIAQASGFPIGSLYHHFRGGKVQIAREALVNAGAEYALLIPSIVDDHTDLGTAIESVFAQAADDMAVTGFANMCPVASVAAEVADTV